MISSRKGQGILPTFPMGVAAGCDLFENLNNLYSYLNEGNFTGSCKAPDASLVKEVTLIS